MKHWIVTLTLGIISAIGTLGGSAFAQRHQLGTVNAETPEGALLQQIGQTDDAAKQVALLEQFAAQHPKHEAIGWVYEQLQAAYLKVGQPDKTIEAGEKLVAIDASDLDAAHNNLKAAEAKKDPDLVRKWSSQTSQIARKVVASPKPAEADAAEDWNRRTDFARQLDTYTEYSLYAVALQTTDAGKRAQLGEELIARNPKSQYMPLLGELAVNAYRQLGQNDKALVLGAKALEQDQSSEDILAFVANQYLEQKRDPDKVVAYSAKIVELMGSKPKPQGVSDADWAKKKATLTGLAHFMGGSTLYNQKKLAEANKELRAGLPLVEGNDQLKAATLFYAGLVNYDMKNTADALKFNQQCAAIKSPFQAKAAQNVKVMQQQAAAGK
jgi:tetratricopeptide (TPR) repeat protein